MQKFTIETASATLRGPVELRLFNMDVQQRNATVLGTRWPPSGLFSLEEGEAITLQAGDVLISDPAALDDGSEDKPARKGKGKGKAKDVEADAD